MAERRYCIGIPTANRGREVIESVTAALANADTEVIVVDQNHDDRLVEALAPVADNPALRHVRIERRGAGHARNVAIALSGTDVICFTDDDCIVPPDYAVSMAGVFDAHPDAGVVFADVSAERDDTEGHVPHFAVTEENVIERFRPSLPRGDLGIGAGMAVRRAAMDDVGGFDNGMGPGAPFGAAEDRDLAIRTLATGWSVVTTPATSVIHFGARVTKQEIHELMQRDHIGMGGQLAKLVRARMRGAVPYASFVLGRMIGDVVRSSIKHRRPHGLRRLAWVAAGLRRSGRIPVDRDRHVYRTGPLELPPDQAAPMTRGRIST